MPRSTPKHKAPGQHHAGRRGSVRTVTPTLAVVTCAGLGVASTLVGGEVVTDRLAASSSVVASVDAEGGASDAADQRSGQRGADAGGGPARVADLDAAREAAQQREGRGDAARTFQPPDDSPTVATGQGRLDRTEVERARSLEREQAAAQEPSGSAQEVARGLVADYGWSESEYSCLVSLWDNESGWDHTATNPTTGAYGIPQALPGSKMATAGSDWESNAATQVAWGLEYISGRYGTPCSAWSFWQGNNWY